MSATTEMLSPLVDVATAAMESFVTWAQEHEWICRKSLFLVTPGEGLDSKALELADTISLDAGTMKVCARAVAEEFLCRFAALLAVQAAVFVGTHRFEIVHGARDL